jgi:hypothetical protein
MLLSSDPHHGQATALANLGSLSPGFQAVTTLTRPLESLLQRFTSLMKEFGQFCEYVEPMKPFRNDDSDWPIQFQSLL